MKHALPVLGALCVVLFIIVLILIKPDVTPLVGFWEADDSFKDDSSLSEAYMYVGCREDGATHPSYILFVNNDNEVIMNQSMDVLLKYSTLRRNWNWSTKEEITNDILPRNMKLEYDPIDGVIQLTKGGVLYARFIKNNKLSHMCKPDVRGAITEEMNDSDDE